MPQWDYMSKFTLVQLFKVCTHTKKKVSSSVDISALSLLMRRKQVLPLLLDGAMVLSGYTSQSHLEGNVPLPCIVSRIASQADPCLLPFLPLYLWVFVPPSPEGLA